MARPSYIWTEEVLEDLIIYYPITSNKILAQRYNISVMTLCRKAKEMKLRKTRLFRFKFEIWDLVKEKYGTASVKEIAKETGVSERTVYRVIRRLRMEMDEECKSEIYRNAAKRMIKLEHSRQTFGLEPKVNRPLGKNKARREIVKQLSKHGYIVIKGSMFVYYCASMPRYEDIEAKAKSIGYKLVLWEKE